MLASSIALFVATAEIGTPAAAAMERALAQAMEATVELRALATPAHAALSEACAAGDVTAAVAVTWADAEHLAATVAVRACASGREQTHRLAFAPADPERERGRALGMVIAAGLRRPAPEAPPAPTEPRAIVAAPGSSAAPALFSLEAFAAGLVAATRAGSGVGAGMAARWHPAPDWDLRLGGRAWAGTVGVAQASLLGLGVAVGTARRLRPARGALPAVALRAEAELLYESLTHFSSDDPEPVPRGRFLPAAAGGFELAWLLGGTLSLHTAVVIEAALGRTEVLVRGVKVAELGVLRGQLEVGFRASF